MKDTDGKDLGSAFFNRECQVGELMNVGGKEVEIDSVLDKEAYMSGKIFLKTTEAPAPAPLIKNPASGVAKFKPVTKVGVTTVPARTVEKPPAKGLYEISENSFLLPKPPAGWT